MNITQFSIRNPLVVAALAISLALFGIYSYLTLGVAVVPSISAPVVLVTTTEPGANPDTMETQITKPIEDAISTLRDIDRLTSTSTQGVSTVTVQFTTAANADLVGVDVERVVNGARSIGASRRQCADGGQSRYQLNPGAHVRGFGPPAARPDRRRG